jgi:hypothetical protein
MPLPDRFLPNGPRGKIFPPGIGPNPRETRPTEPVARDQNRGRNRKWGDTDRETSRENWPPKTAAAGCAAVAPGAADMAPAR